ncbi:MAG: peptide MFS transporter [Marinifilaceae bacterium]
MFKNHPKGLLAAALANMGERFGFYTMMAILVLFLMAKFNLTKVEAGVIYSVFYALIYLLALAGGIIADKTKNFKGTILTGLVVMALGYVMLAIPTPIAPESRTFYLVVSCIGLFIIAFGNGLFKGNLQALVGQMYDDPKYGQFRDSGFSIFYMFINVGAIFAPMIATGVRNWWLSINGFKYDAGLPELCHNYIAGSMNPEATERFREMASLAANSGVVTDLGVFANEYLGIFTTGFHYAFATAIGAMAISLGVFLLTRKSMPDPANKVVQKDASGATVEMSAQEVKQRLYALFAVFGIVIFFWFSFHQNGLTLTYFAKDYTLLQFGDWSFSAELFQSLNPFFVVFLTPVVLGLFGWLKAKGKEPSTPAKIAIGMGIAASAYVVMAMGSFGLPNLSEVEAAGGLSAGAKASPYLLMGTYLILTVAELFISPLGISFVSKVAPPQYQGIMQGCWLGATALGNQLLFIGAIFYSSISIWATWTIFVGACLISMFTMLAMLKWIERISEPKKSTNKATA